MSHDLSPWMAALSEAEAGRRAAAAETLAGLGAEARAAAVPLVRATGDQDEAVREWAAAALEDLGPPALDDLPALVRLLADAHVDQGLRPEAGQAGAPDVRYWAATLLGRLGTGAAPAVPALAAALDATAPLPVRQRAAWALGQIGPAAGSAREALHAAARDPDPRLARLARAALERL